MVRVRLSQLVFLHEADRLWIVMIEKRVQDLCENEPRQRTHEANVEQLGHKEGDSEPQVDLDQLVNAILIDVLAVCQSWLLRDPVIGVVLHYPLDVAHQVRDIEVLEATPQSNDLYRVEAIEQTMLIKVYDKLEGHPGDEVQRELPEQIPLCDLLQIFASLRLTFRHKVSEEVHQDRNGEHNEEKNVGDS